MKSALELKKVAEQRYDARLEEAWTKLQEYIANMAAKGVLKSDYYVEEADLADELLRRLKEEGITAYPEYPSDRKLIVTLGKTPSYRITFWQWLFGSRNYGGTDDQG